MEAADAGLNKSWCIGWIDYYMPANRLYATFCALEFDP